MRLLPSCLQLNVTGICCQRALHLLSTVWAIPLWVWARQHCRKVGPGVGAQDVTAHRGLLWLQEVQYRVWSSFCWSMRAEQLRGRTGWPWYCQGSRPDCGAWEETCLFPCASHPHGTSVLITALLSKSQTWPRSPISSLQCPGVWPTLPSLHLLAQLEIPRALSRASQGATAVYARPRGCLGPSLIHNHSLEVFGET